MALEEDEEVEKVLGKEGVKEALSDPKIQQLFSFLKDDPPKAQRFVLFTVMSLSLSLSLWT